jgi:hypothetical protein
VKPKVYVETKIPSLLTAWPSRDMEIAVQQLATREWWDTRREDFDLYVSADVLDEAERGDAEAARLRLAALAEFQVLSATEEAQLLTKRILATGLIPPGVATDAAHIGIAAAHGMGFLLTWNCRHNHNSSIERRLAGVCGAMGFALPVLCTPRELMAQ